MKEFEKINKLKNQLVANGMSIEDVEK